MDVFFFIVGSGDDVVVGCGYVVQYVVCDWLILFLVFLFEWVEGCCDDWVVFSEYEFGVIVVYDFGEFLNLFYMVVVKVLDEFEYFFVLYCVFDFG